MNNHVLFHDLRREGCPLSSEKEYLGTVEAIQLNSEYAAVLSSGRIALDQVADSSGASWDLPGDKAHRDVTCMALTPEFLIYGTKRGTITYLYLPAMAQVSEFVHESSVSRAYCVLDGNFAFYVVANEISYCNATFNPPVYCLHRRRLWHYFQMHLVLESSSWTPRHRATCCPHLKIRFFRSPACRMQAGAPRFYGTWPILVSSLSSAHLDFFQYTCTHPILSTVLQWL